MWAMAWPLIRPILPYLLAAGAVYAGWWYVGSLRAEITQQRADLEVERDKLSKAHANIRQRIDAERQQRGVNDESAKLARMARDATSSTASGLRKLRSATLPAVTASNSDGAGHCTATDVPIAEAATGGVEGTAQAIDLACSETDAELSVLKAEILRLDRALTRE